jgi:cob(I)alamin adenosyltransferase
MIAQLESPIVETPSRPAYAISGLVQVFTSTHRCFFTNVMAQALRIAGQGTPVLVVQFLKGGIGGGKENPVRLGQNLEWIRCNLPRCIDTPELEQIEVAALRELWEHTQQAVMTGKYDLVVLDELSLAIHFGLIPEEEVIELLDNRPGHVDIILTGPNMPNTLLDQADQITQIRRSHRP